MRLVFLTSHRDGWRCCFRSELNSKRVDYSKKIALTHNTHRQLKVNTIALQSSFHRQVENLAKSGGSQIPIESRGPENAGDRAVLHPKNSQRRGCCIWETFFPDNCSLRGYYPIRTVSIETEPPSTPSTGKLTASSLLRSPRMYSRGR